MGSPGPFPFCKRRYGGWARSSRWSIRISSARSSISIPTMQRRSRTACRRRCSPITRRIRIAFRGGERYAARLARSAPPARATRAKLERPEHRPFQLQISKRGVIDNLILRPGARHHPKPGEVEIRVLATGLNFRDVLITLGIYPDDSTILGLECAGTIASVGDGVEEFHVGDEVIAYAHGSFGSFATVPSDFVAHRPKRLSLEEAATIPIVFLTAHYTLRCSSRRSSEATGC